MVKNHKKIGVQLAAIAVCTSILPVWGAVMAEEKNNTNESVVYEEHNMDKVELSSNDFGEDNKNKITTDSEVKISPNIDDLDLENKDNTLKNSDEDFNVKIKVNEANIEKPAGGVLSTVGNEMSKENIDKLSEYNPEENKRERILFSRNRAAGITRYCSDYAFEYLADFSNGENMQKAYKDITAYCNKVHNGEIDIDSNSISGYYCLSKVNIYKYNLTTDELFKVFLSIRADHPEFFWLNSQYSYGVSEQDKNKVIYFIPQVLSHYKTKDERSDMNERLENAISDFLSEIDGDTDFEKELQIHDKIARETVYDYYYDYSLNDYNIAGVLIDHVGVCESYTKTMQLLLNACGIDNIYVAGVVNTGSGDIMHAWNQVCIEENYYNIDSTWDDQESGIIYEYFNAKDEDFPYHFPFTPDDSEYQYPIKKCNSDEANYYWVMSKNGYVLDSEDKIEEYVKRRTIESLEDNKFTIVIAGKTSEITEKIISYIGNNFVGLLKNDTDVNKLWIEKCDTNNIDAKIYGKTVNIYLKPKGEIPVTKIEIPKELTFDKLLNAVYIVPVISPSYAADINNQQWISGDENVVLVNNGEIIAVGQGDTDVTVKTGGKEAVCHIKVEPKDYPIQQEIPVSEFKVSPNNAELYESGTKSTQQFKVTLEPDNATDKEVIWYSDDNNIVEIDQNGLATAVGVGKTTIYCIPNGLIEGGKYSKYNVIVKPVTKISEIKITGSNVINVKGGSINLSAIVSPDDSTYTDVIWTIDSGEDIAQIDNNGKLTAKGTGNGNVVVKAEANDGSRVFKTKTITLSNQAELVNKAELEALYNANKDKTQKNYTSASWIAFSTALSNAKNILDKEDAAQSEVDAVKSKLQTAINELKGTSSSSSSSSSSKHKHSSDSKENEQSKVNVSGNSNGAAEESYILNNNIINTLYTNRKVEIKSIETETAVTETGEDYPITVITTSENKQIKTLRAQTNGRLTVKGNSDEHVYAFVPQINKYVEISAEKTANNIKFNNIKNETYVITADNQQMNVTNKGWNKENNDWYYIDSNGQVKTGWFKDNNKWYNFNSQGKMQTGWLNEGGNWYYMKSGGEMATGWQQIENKWYYLRADGTMQKGWMWEGGNWYYLCENGEMATGWKQIGSQWYYLYANGKMAVNTTISGYKFGTDGTWIK